MSAVSSERVKVSLGLLLGVCIGALCRWLDVPSPAPTIFTGSLLVVSMTLGYIATDRWVMQREARSRPLCGGPDGSTKGLPGNPQRTGFSDS
jgi:XapX domain-containing protein